jgi:hypothetical protein
MSTNREVISRVRSTHKLFADASLNDRAILAELRSNALNLINQRTNLRKFWNTATIFTPIDCLEMEPVGASECCGMAGGETFSKSKLKLPSILDSNYQYLIQGVYDVNKTVELKYMPLNRYINTKKLGLRTTDVYYFIQDNHLYTTSPQVQMISLLAAFEGDVPYEILYPDCDCNGKKKAPCTSRLDDEFKCPGALVGPVVTMTSQSLLQTYFRIPTDQTSDNKNDQTNMK